MPTNENSVISQIASFLLGKGLTREQTAGILGNFKIESGFRTDAYNPNENAIGLAQWQGGRRTALQAFAASIGAKETDLRAQLGFMWQELTSTESTALRHLATSRTAGEAAAAFDQYYERSSGAARNARISAANAYLPNIGPGAGDGGYIWDQATGLASGPSIGGSGPINRPVGYDPDTDEYTVDSPYDQDPLWKQMMDGLAGGMAGFIFKIVLVTGGIAIVGIGLAQAVRPAVTKAKDAAITVVQTAKSASPASAL